MGQTTHTFSYSSENRLRQIQQGMSSVEFAYDGLGRRISRTVGSGMSATTTHFFYDGDRVINEITGSAPYVDAYRYGVGLIRRNNEWPLFDAQGNNRKVTAANQSVSAAFVYDAFGNVTYSSGSASLKNKYCGDWGYRDDGDTFASLSASAGLMHVGARYYDPTTGRFTTRDTLLTEHPYVYCNADPVNAVDFTGRLPVFLLVIGAAAVAVAVTGCSRQSQEKAKAVGGAAAGAGATPGLGEASAVLELTPDAVRAIKDKVERTKGGMQPPYGDFSREYPKYER